MAIYEAAVEAVPTTKMYDLFGAFLGEQIESSSQEEASEEASEELLGSAVSSFLSLCSKAQKAGRHPLILDLSIARYPFLMGYCLITCHCSITMCNIGGSHIDAPFTAWFRKGFDTSTVVGKCSSL